MTLKARSSSPLSQLILPQWAAKPQVLCHAQYAKERNRVITSDALLLSLKFYAGTKHLPPLNNATKHTSISTLPSHSSLYLSRLHEIDSSWIMVKNFIHQPLQFSTSKETRSIKSYSPLYHLIENDFLIIGQSSMPPGCTHESYGLWNKTPCFRITAGWSHWANKINTYIDQPAALVALSETKFQRFESVVSWDLQYHAILSRFTPNGIKILHGFSSVFTIQTITAWLPHSQASACCWSAVTAIGQNLHYIVNQMWQDTFSPPSLTPTHRTSGLPHDGQSHQPRYCIAVLSGIWLSGWTAWHDSRAQTVPRFYLIGNSTNISFSKSVVFYPTITQKCPPPSKQMSSHKQFPMVLKMSPQAHSGNLKSATLLSPYSPQRRHSPDYQHYH